MSHSAARFPVSLIEGLAERMADMPPPEPVRVSTRELIRRVAPGLQAMRAQGYPIGSIVQFLQKHGVLAGQATLRGYVLQELASMRPKRPSRRRAAPCPPFAWAKPAAVLGPAPPVVPAGPREIVPGVDEPSDTGSVP